LTPILKKSFDFFIFTSLYIAVGAVLMTYQTVLLFNLDFSWTLAGFVFSGSVCSYNFHWYLTPPAAETPSKKIAWNISNRNLHLVLFIVGLVGSAVFSIMLVRYWLLLGITALATFLYSAPMIAHPLFSQLKKVAIGKTIYLAFAWMHVTVLLPILMEATEFEWKHFVFIVNRFFFIYAICILFDFRDVDQDRKAGIKSLITYLNKKQVNVLFWGSLVIVALTSFAMLNHFSMPVVLILLLPAIILSLLYYHARRDFSDYLYYFVLDGLMMLSAPLLLLLNLPDNF
jgi:1,4-dihydroxy-2-naphthoate octaprenyltransferase